MDIGIFSSPGLPLFLSTFLIYLSIEECIKKEKQSDVNKKRLKAGKSILTVILYFHLFFWGVLPFSIHLIGEY
jgi:hypothetical protein